MIRHLGKLWFLGLLGFAPRLFNAPRAWGFFFLFFFVPLIADVVRAVRSRVGSSAKREEIDSRVDSSAKREEPDLPLPGPSRRYGAAGMTLRYHLSTFLAMLNPYQLAQMLKQAVGNVSADRQIDAAGDSRTATYALPFDGDWLVAQGGVTEATSHSWDIIGQRYAYDFVRADGNGERHTGDGTRVDQYLCYDQPIRAIADGVVVEVEDAIRDAPWVGTGWVDWLVRDFGGNSVTIRHADHVYSYSAHLIPRSIPVRVGQTVRRGDAIGRCGNSGHSTEPHLHFQLQDGPASLRAVGLPIFFESCIVDDSVVLPPVTLSGGMRVRRIG